MTYTERVQLGIALRETRERLNVTQRAVAEMLDVTQGAISLFESGRRAPSADHAEAIRDLINDPEVRL